MKKTENIPYDTKDPSQLLDVMLPDADTYPVFLYFHGGGIQAGDKGGERFYQSLVDRGVAVVSANYRMYPKARYPEFIEDAASALAYVAREFGSSARGIYVGGSSAGGYLSQMLLFDKSYLARHGIDPDKISGWVLDAGQPTTHFNVLRERGLDTRRVVIDEAAPIWHIDAGRDWPPMQIIVSDCDMQNRYEQTTLLISTLKHFGCPDSVIDYRFMKNSRHCAYVNAKDAEGNWIFADMIYDFITHFPKKEDDKEETK